MNVKVTGRSFKGQAGKEEKKKKEKIGRKTKHLSNRSPCFVHTSHRLLTDRIKAGIVVINAVE